MRPHAGAPLSASAIVERAGLPANAVQTIIAVTGISLFRNKSIKLEFAHGLDQDQDIASDARVRKSESFAASRVSVNEIAFTRPQVWSAGLRLAIQGEVEGSLEPQPARVVDQHNPVWRQLIEFRAVVCLV